MGIRKRLREVGGDLQQGISEAKQFIRSRKAPPRVKGQPSLAFAVVPTNFIQAPKRVQRPRKIRRGR